MLKFKSDGRADAEVAQTERIGLGDLLISAGVAVVTCLLLDVWEFPGLHPAVWNDAVVASGVRPAVSVLPGFWRLIASIVYSLAGLGGGNHMFRLLGHFTLALIAMGVYVVLREMLAFVMRARPQQSPQRTFVMRIASVVGAVAFVFSEPVWTAGQCFSETTLLILLSIIATVSFFVFLRKGEMKYSYFCALALGLLTAETPFGLVLVAAFVGLNLFVLKVMPSMESPFFKPALIAVGKWHMTFLYLAALVVGIGLNCATFVLHDGLSAVGQTAGQLPFAYLSAYWGRIVDAADPLGWVLLVGVCLAPFLVAIFRFPTAADEETFLSYATGVVFLVTGVMAAAQSCSLPSLWFWSYGEVESQFLLSCGTLLTAMTLACAVTILGVDALCRNHERLARQMFGNDDEETDEESDEAARAEEAAHAKPGPLRTFFLWAIPTVLVFSMLPGRIKDGTRGMLAVIHDAITETVLEAGDVSYLFTDGNLDVAVEMASRGHGRQLKCLSMMRNTTAMSAYLATRGMENDAEDLFCFRHDCGTGLRSWIRDRPERLKSCAVQMGFDLWKRDGKRIPPIGGMLSLPTGWKDDRVRRESVTRAYALIDRVLALYAKGAVKDCTDPSVRRALCHVQWRLARMCLYRAERADLDGDTATANTETELAKKLNAHNEIFQRLVSVNEKYRKSMLTRLTPREGMQLALVRADFAMAKGYAETIIAVDPENANANFALGMYYALRHQMNRAEAFLTRCLIHEPNQPTYYNNLAMVQLELGKLDAAEVNVNKALALVPDSDEIRDTQKRIRDAREGKAAHD